MSQVLVVGAGPAAAELGAGVAKLATQLAQRGGIWVRVVAVAAAAADGLPDPIGFSLVRDSEGAFAQTYGAQPGLTMMVRPDGYLGLLAGALQPAAVLAYLDRLAAAPGAG